MEARRKHRINIFGKFYLGFVFVLIVLFALAMIYVRGSLSEFEASQPENYAARLTKDVEENGANSEIGRALRESFAAEANAELEEQANAAPSGSEYVKYLSADDRIRLFDESLGSASLTLEKSPLSYDASAPLYNILADGEVIGTARLRSENPHTRLGLMTISDWAIDEVKANSAEISDRSRIAVTEEEFPVKNALEIAETWSKLMTNDLSGPRHGVDQVLKYLVPNSYLARMAYEFATSVDITFVSRHVLSGFTGESVSNYEKLSDRLYACDVYFVKNITLTTMKGTREDIFDSKLYFVYLDETAEHLAGWYLADML